MIEIDRLYQNAIDAQSRWFDWSRGWGETWEHISVGERLACDTCYETLYADEEGDDGEALHTLGGPCPRVYGKGEGGPIVLESCGGELEEYDDPDEGPMMNYFYPLPGFHGDPQEAARTLENAKVSLCLIQLRNTIEDEEYGLALTGGGMDLSWDICHAYVVLGYLPPLHFCHLPQFAGHNYASEENAVTLEACKASARATMRYGQQELEYLEGLGKEPSLADRRGTDSRGVL